LCVGIGRDGVGHNNIYIIYMKKNNKLNNNMVIVLPVIILIIIFTVLSYYCYYYYTVSKRRKVNVKERMKVLTELYSVVVDVADENNIKPFLLYGSLLGQQRNNQIICYDFDIDMGVLSTEFYKLYTALNKNINTDKYTIILKDNFFYGKKFKL
jgi:hypothetical protein